MSVEMAHCDFDDPASVVSAFLAAMNGWEVGAWQSQRACRDSDDPSSHQAGVLSDMAAIFALYCTPKERKFGRNGSFQKPTEYDPAHECVLHPEVGEDRKRAFVTTLRETVLSGERYRYALVREQGRWHIDTLKREFNNDWENAIL